MSIDGVLNWICMLCAALVLSYLTCWGIDLARGRRWVVDGADYVVPCYEQRLPVLPEYHQSVTVEPIGA